MLPSQRCMQTTFVQELSAINNLSDNIETSERVFLTCSGRGVDMSGTSA